MNQICQSAPSLAPAALAVVGVGKSFGAVRALREITLEFDAGTVTGLLGENGAGKSTLIMLCSGVMRPDTGEIRVDGKRVDWRSPLDAMHAGVAVVNQEPQLISELTIADNIFLMDLAERPGFAIAHRKALVRKARELLSRLKLSDYLPDPEMVCRNLSAAERQIVDIVRALSRDPKVLFLDEPNSSLTHQETERLFAVVHQMREAGVAVVFVSHRLAEVYEIVDRVIVLRDGRFIAAGYPGEIHQSMAIELMAGERKMAEVGRREASVESSPQGELALHLDRLSGAGFEDVTLSVHRGEIVGMAGLVGAGRSEIAAAVVGLTRPTSGSIRINGRVVRPRNPRHTQKLGLCYVAEERRTELFHVQSIGYNLTARVFDLLSRMGMVSGRRQARFAEDLARRFGVKAESTESLISSLSGGNQQKVILARALATKPRVFILDEPTRGVDVGTKAEIYGMLRGLARDEGLAIWFISSELQEVMELAERIVVIRHGHVVMDAPNTSDPNLVVAAAMGATES